MAIFKIAKTGGTVSDDEKDLAFTSARNCIIEMFSGTIDISTDGDGFGAQTYTHNLGYIPACYCFVRDPLNTGRWYPHQDGYMACNTYVDTTKLYTAINYKEASQTYRIFYSIFGNNQDNTTGTGNNNVSGKLRISKDGYDAETETDARNMQFFSGKNVLKIDSALSGSTTITINSPVVTKTIAHNLGYVPIVFVLNTKIDSYEQGQMLPITVGSLNVSYYIDSINLVIIVEDIFGGGSPSFTMDFKYKILKDKIA